MNKKGLKIGFLGDSITTGGGASSFDKSYVGLFQTLNKDYEIYNYGLGGTRISTNTTPYNANYDNNQFYTRVSKMREDLDLIFVFGGTNDFGHGDALIGKETDRTEYTFFGALNLLTERLIKKYPTKRIIYLTPLHRSDEKEEKNALGLERSSLKEYVDAIKNRCEYYSIPVIDLYSTSMINPLIKESCDAMTVDGLHPNDKGYRRIYEIIDAYINSL